MTRDENIINANQGSFDWLGWYVKPKYNDVSSIQWADTEACKPNLYIKKGDIIKKREPMKEYASDFVYFFKILNETNNCRYKVVRYQNEKYWKLSEIKDFNNLKIKAKNGIESV